MLRFFNKRLHNRKGFTLIELIVVIAILGILAIIAIPRFAGVRENAEDKAMLSTATSILNAAEVRYQDDDTFRPADAAVVNIVTALVDEDYLRDGDYTDYALTHVADGSFSVGYTDNQGAQTID